MLSKPFSEPLALVCIAVGAWGFYLTEEFIYGRFGFVGVIVSVIIFPVAYTVAPLMAGILDRYWLPAAACYVPVFLMWISARMRNE